MQTVSKRVVLPYTRQQMFNLVNAIEDYPLFLPWCKSVQVHYRRAVEVKATMSIAKGPVKFDVTTVNMVQEHNLINLKLANGPFRNLDGSWKFSDIENGKCLIDFEISFQFANKLFAIALEPFFLGVSNTLVDAFAQRAAEVYAKQ